MQRTSRQRRTAAEREKAAERARTYRARPDNVGVSRVEHNLVDTAYALARWGYLTTDKVDDREAIDDALSRWTRDRVQAELGEAAE